jgi:hypothetical protein
VLPLLWVLHFCLEIGSGAAVGADEDGVRRRSEEGADALVVPCVRARGDEERLARLGVVSTLLASQNEGNAYRNVVETD